LAKLTQKIIPNRYDGMSLKSRQTTSSTYQIKPCDIMKHGSGPVRSTWELPEGCYQ
jgi:hypothetical protein